MAYKQSPASVLKGQMTNKAVGLAHGDSMAMQTDPKTGKKRKVKPFVDPGAPEGFAADAPDVGEFASKKFFKSQDIVNKAVQTLEDIDAGKGTYTGYVNSDQTVKRALLGKDRPDVMTTGQLKSLSKSDPVKGMEYISQNIRNAPLGDAASEFNRSYNPFKKK